MWSRKCVIRPTSLSVSETVRSKPITWISIRKSQVLDRIVSLMWPCHTLSDLEMRNPRVQYFGDLPTCTHIVWRRAAKMGVVTNVGKSAFLRPKPRRRDPGAHKLCSRPTVWPRRMLTPDLFAVANLVFCISKRMQHSRVCGPLLDRVSPLRPAASQDY